MSVCVIVIAIVLVKNERLLILNGCLKTVVVVVLALHTKLKETCDINKKKHVI